MPKTLVSIVGSLFAMATVSMLVAGDRERDPSIHLSFDSSGGDSGSVDLKGHQLVDGVAGKAVRFDGDPAQGLRLGDLKIKAPATVAFWIKTRDFWNGRCLLVQTDGPITQAGRMRLQGGLEVWDGKAWQLVVHDGVRLNTWTHLAVVFSADGKATGYLNGKAQETVGCGFDFDGVNAGFGTKATGHQGAVYNGLLDELRVYKLALSADDIPSLCHVAKH